MGTPTANELLMGVGGTSATFPTIGSMVSGEIVSEPKVQQQQDPNTNAAKTFPNGDAMLQIVVQLQTEIRESADDDGIRNLYIKANMLKAVREAVRAAGAEGLERGGTLAVVYTADGEKTQKAFNAPKLYQAAYRAPVTAANALLGMTSPQPAAAPNVGVAGPALTPPPPPQTYTAPPPPPAPPTVPAPTGVDPAVWAQLTPAQRAALSGVSPALPF